MIHAIRHLAAPTLYVTTDNVLVYLNIKATPSLVVALSVCLTPNVHTTRRVSKINVLIRVQELVALMPYVKYSITCQCVVVPKACPETHSTNVMSCHVNISERNFYLLLD